MLRLRLRVAQPRVGELKRSSARRSPQGEEGPKQPTSGYVYIIRSICLFTLQTPSALRDVMLLLILGRRHIAPKAKDLAPWYKIPRRAQLAARNGGIFFFGLSTVGNGGGPRSSASPPPPGCGRRQPYRGRRSPRRLPFAAQRSGRHFIFNLLGSQRFLVRWPLNDFGEQCLAVRAEMHRIRQVG